MNDNPTVHDHFRHPRCAGTFPARTTGVATAQVGEALRGGVIRLQLKTEDEHIVAVRQQVYGSAYLIAAASWLADWLQDKSLIEAKRFDKRFIEDALQLPSSKVQCAVLAERALHDVLQALESH